MVAVSESVIWPYEGGVSRKADSLGAGQLVRLYAQMPGIPLGVFIRNKDYVLAKPIVRTGLEYRAELSQRVNDNGLHIAGAQRHARKISSSGHFDFA